MWFEVDYQNYARSGGEVPAGHAQTRGSLKGLCVFFSDLRNPLRFPARQEVIRIVPKYTK